MCHTCVTRVLHVCYTCVTRVTCVAHKSYTCVTRVLHEYYTSATRVLHVCYTSVTRVLHSTCSKRLARKRKMSYTYSLLTDVKGGRGGTLGSDHGKWV